MGPTQSGSHASLVHVVAESADPARLPLANAHIDQSWQRCLRDFNLDPDRDYAPTVLDQAMISARQNEFDELVHIARAEMDSLYEQIAGSGFALLLADTQGVILCEKVDPNLKRMFYEAGLMVGADWGERCEGTNGIGTCAAEARPVTIHQSDHFRSRHVGLSCSGAPIHNAKGELIAVLDASSVHADSGRASLRHTAALVNMSACLIEKCLFLRHHQGDAMLRFHHRPELVDLLHDGAIAVAGDGIIVGSDAMGLKLLGVQSRDEVIGRSIAEVFNTSYEQLRSAARVPHRAMWELRDARYGRRYFASLVDTGQSTGRVSSAAICTPSIVRLPKPQKVGPLTLEDLAGEDPLMLRNLRNARRVSDYPVSVLLHGPTGSGKEAFAKAIHLRGSRSAKPFVAVNCAAIPETLIEAELFGYTPGAFTGARRDGMRGRILQSSGGTLFLDEIGDMPLLMQTRLLRVLEEQEVTPLGSDTAHRVDLRVIAASHWDLNDLIDRGQFREDLYYRLNGITLELPALAQRRDREAVIQACLARELAASKATGIDSQALQKLIDYDWPGNIRELRNAIRSALAISENNVIRVSDLQAVMRNQARVRSGAEALAPRQSPINGGLSLKAAEREVLIQAIERHGGNMTNVAAELKISRNTLYRKIKRHGIKMARRADGEFSTNAACKAK